MPLTRPLILRHAGNLRKCRLGNNGRFSTDIDFAVARDDDVVDLCAEINGARVGGFTFSLDKPSDSARIWSLHIQHAELGNVMGLARLEFARRRLAISPEHLVPIRLPIHDQYAFTLGALPVVAEAEACAEKLARYRRVALARDLYDLAWFATRPFDERLIRRLWVLKVYCDVVDDKRGNGPLTAAEVLKPRDAKDFPVASIGVCLVTVRLMVADTPITIDFDRGTLRLTGRVEQIPAAARPLLVWDERTENYRAEARHYSLLMNGAFSSSDVTISDVNTTKSPFLTLSKNLLYSRSDPKVQKHHQVGKPNYPAADFVASTGGMQFSVICAAPLQNSRCQCIWHLLIETLTGRKRA